MFNYIVLLLCAFYLWSSAIAAPYHEADSNLGNPNKIRNPVQTNNDREFRHSYPVIRNSESVSISTSPEAENKRNNEDIFRDYYDDVLKPSFNVTSDPFAYEDTTETDFTSTRIPLRWNSVEAYVEYALISLIIFILLLCLVKLFG